MTDDEREIGGGTPDDQIFDEAFDAAGQDEPVVANPDIDNDNPAPPDAPVEGDTAPAPEPPPQPPVIEDYEQKWKSLQGIHRSDKEKWEAREAELLAAIEEAKKNKPAPIPAAPSDSLTPDEKAALAEYEKDFDVVSKMEGKKRDAALKQLRDEFMPLLEEIRNKLGPIETFSSEAKSTLEEQARKAHFGELAAAHPDYETYRDDGSILKWIESKPKYMQPALIDTYQGGTVADVIDLLADFKKENNINQAPQAAPEPKVDAKAAKKAALTAPTTRKAAVNANMHVSDDYDGAFDEALHK